MDTKGFTDVEFENVEFLDGGCYYSATQIADILEENPTTIYNWVKQDVFGDLLGIKRVNGRRVYTKDDIENLKFIKELRKKNFSINQTKEYLAKKGFKYSEYDGGLIDTKDPLGFQALAVSIAEENNKKFAEFSKKQETMLKDFGIALLKEVKGMMDENQHDIHSVLDEVCLTIDDKLPKALNDATNDIKEVVSKEVETGLNTIPRTLDISNAHLKDTIEDILDKKVTSMKDEFNETLQKQLEETRKGADMVEKLRLSMSEEKKKYEEEKKLGFLSRLINRK